MENAKITGYPVDSSAGPHVGIESFCFRSHILRDVVFNLDS